MSTQEVWGGDIHFHRHHYHYSDFKSRGRGKPSHHGGPVIHFLNGLDFTLESAPFELPLSPWCFVSREFRRLSFGGYKQITLNAAHCIFPRLICDTDKDKGYWGSRRCVRFLAPVWHRRILPHIVKARPLNGKAIQKLPWVRGRSCHAASMRRP